MIIGLYLNKNHALIVLLGLNGISLLSLCGRLNLAGGTAELISR